MRLQSSLVFLAGYYSQLAPACSSGVQHDVQATWRNELTASSCLVDSGWVLYRSADHVFPKTFALNPLCSPVFLTQLAIPLVSDYSCVLISETPAERSSLAISLQAQLR